MFSIRENRCRRFQANIFNKSKCQNCFKPVDSHRLSEADLYQSKPVQVGWLLLAPDGSDFNSPGHRKRKWQRRYFVLYDHGLLRYSLDEMTGTLPQGSVNMTQCCDIVDGSSQTGFKNCLRLCFTEQDFYIRTENTDSISRWQENLSVYPKAANQRKKRKELEHPQQTEELQTSISSTAKKSSSVGSCFNSHIIRRGSLNSNISGGRVSQAISNALVGTSKGSTVSGASVKRSSSIGSSDKGRAGSVESAVEGVSLISSKKKLEEESSNGGVVVSSGSDNAPSLNTALGSSLSPSLEQFPGCSGSDVYKNRPGIESGYSSLEKTSPLVGETHIDSRCDFASVCVSASQPSMFPAPKSFSSSPFPPPTSHSTRFNGNPEDVVSCSWDRKSLESIEERHTSMTHTLRHNAHQTRSSGRKVQRLSGNQHRRSRGSDQQKNSFTADADAELPSTFTSSSTEQNDHKTAADTSQDSSPNEEIVSRPSTSCSFRSKSLERRIDHTPTPDLLNFKKGWMSRLGEDGKWRKHWFVLTDQTLRFYCDSVAEEAADVDGEINLSTCYDVTDYPVQRNYGFQIHTKDGVFTLCAMTYGIRRNWVQAIMKNIRPAIAPDVTWKQSPLKSSSVPHKVIGAHTGSSQYNTLPQEEEKRSRIRDRRKEGRYKTFDWAELSCKQHKELSSSDLPGKEWNHNCEYQVPPAPASSPEGPIVRCESSASEKECTLKTKLYQSLKNMPNDIPSHSVMVVSNHTSPGSISPDSLEVDAGSVRVYCDSPGDLLVHKPKEKQVNRSTSPLQVNFSSISLQTEWQWEVELQSLRRELKAEHERSQTQERESKLCETRLQSELNNTQGCLQKAEIRIQEVESLLKEREEVLEGLRGRLEDVTACLKATEDAQALKDVRLQRHLRLLQESQERERRSFSDSLEQSEQRLKELEDRLRQKEADLQIRPTGEVNDDFIQKCQELQNQLEESEGEVGRMQARLHTAETFYYDMEHDYEQACEEIQSLRGALQDCERVYEERFQTQLDRKQQELNRKECELQEVLVKMAVLGSSLEETERRLKEAQNPIPKVTDSSDTVLEPQHLFKVSNVRQKMNGKSSLETQPDESDRVISVIQALELKLCDTEDRLRELTMHLQQQQLSTGPYTLNDSSCAHTSIQNLDGRLFVNALQSCTGALNSLQGKAVDRTSDGLGSHWLVGESQGIASRVLSLEALIIQRMASALEHPSRELLNKLSDLHVQVLRMDQGSATNGAGAVQSSYSQIFLYSQEQDQKDSTLSESAIQRLCVRAEMAYLIHTLHTHPLQEQQGSEPFIVLPWPAHSSGSKKENVSKQVPKLADISPPELAPYSEQMEELAANLLLEESEVQLACRKNLVADLHAQAQSLQDLSTRLHFNVKEADVPAELPTGILRVAVCQATLAYMACRLRSAVQQEMSALRKQREQAEYEARAMCRSMEVLFQEQTERYEEKLRERRVVAEKAEQGRVSAETDAQLRVDEAERLQVEFEEKLQELQKIHEEEMSRLHKYYIQNMSKSKTPTLSVQKENGETEEVSVIALQDQIQDLQSEITCLKQELSKQDVKTFQLDLENVKATYEHGFSVMEESHQRVIEEMQRQHQREVERLTEERERVLLEETNATIAAIEAMRKAHKKEIDKTQKAQQNGATVDIRQLHAQYNEELESLHRELEVLSEQYSQKCLENTHLTQTMVTEREALSITQRENQELRTHNRELNECLTAELSLMHSRMNGEVKHTQSSQEKDIYQLEVNLRVKESEIKCLKQEISSLKIELQAANTHFKDLQSELSALGVKTQSDFTKLMMEPSRKQSLKYDVMKSRSNSDFIEDCSTLSQAVRSKDGLTVLERMKLFELTGTQKI